MRWTHLGHACWYVETADARVLFDPLLGETYHDGVFEVFPRRRLELARLRPDVVVVTHRHPDHFDLESLARLAALGCARLLLTADELVARAARRLGFPEVVVLGNLEAHALGDTRLVPTPSFCDVVEWGMLVATADGVAWNQVDSVLVGPDEIQGILTVAAALLERPALERGPELALARWQPLLQVNAHTSGAIGFPFAAYEGELRRAAASGAPAIVPGAAGNRYVGPGGWQNGLVYPVSEDRFRRDLQRLRPGATIYPSGPGLRLELAGGVARRLADADWVTPIPAPDDRVFAPLTIPPIRERALSSEGPARARIETWLNEQLRPALARAWPSFGAASPLRFALELVFSDARVGRTIVVSPDGARLEDGLDPDYDLLNSVAASPLLAVLEGRAHWGSALLGGQMRSTTRAYRIDAGRLTRLRVAPFAAYYWLPYERATERWVEARLAELTRHAARR